MSINMLAFQNMCVQVFVINFAIEIIFSIPKLNFVIHGFSNIKSINNSYSINYFIIKSEWFYSNKIIIYDLYTEKIYK